MTDEPINLAERRAVSACDCEKWTPLDAAKALVQDLESGKIKPDRLVVHYIERTEDGGMNHHFMAAGVTYETHLSLLTIATFQLMDQWRR